LIFSGKRFPGNAFSEWLRFQHSNDKVRKEIAWNIKYKPDMRRLLLIAPLFLALFLVACDKDKKENPDPNPQLSEKDKILINYPWRMSDVTDLNGKSIPLNLLNTQTRAIKEVMDIQFLQNNVTKAIDQGSKQVINGGTWYLKNDDKMLDIKISGFSGEFGEVEISNSKLKLKSKMPVDKVEQETIMVFEPVIK